jgi:Ca-activated chloride channel family protein
MAALTSEEVSPMQLRTLLTAVLLLAVPAAAAEPVHVELILDASGSMWNKLADGRYRIAAAKEALTELISVLPETPDLHVGLRVYGSQVHYSEPGSCEDTKLFVPMQGVDRPRLLSTVQRAKAVGSTPIAKSLDLAAQDLKGEGKKLVVLVTDGEESCGGDVAAAVERLRAAGVEAEIRIVGIGLNPDAVARFGKLAQIVNVDDAKSLAKALQDATREAAAPAPAKEHGVTVRVSLLGKPVAGATVQFVESISGAAHVFQAGSEPGLYKASLKPGAYTARVAAAEADPKEQEFSGLAVSAASENTFTLELVARLDVRLAVEPASVAAGKPVTVRFEGAPAVKEQWIGLGPVGDDKVVENWVEAAGASGSVSIRTQDRPGRYEARLYLGEAGWASRPVGRSQPFEVTLPQAKVEPPAQMPAGSQFDVAWSGPDNPGDYVTVVEAGAPEGSYRSYSNTSQGSPAGLQAPDEPGRYEVRYVTGQSGKTLASAPVEVQAVQASVQAPASVKAGSRFDVTWSGPDNRGDYVTIVPASAEEGTYRDYRNTQEGSPVQLRAPVEPGAHEVRYVSGQSQRTLARAPVEVQEVSGRVEAPQRVKAGESFEVRWSGPDNPGDYVTIVKQGAPDGEYLSYAYTRDGATLRIEAPQEPGAYEVRYVMEPGARTLARTPVAVE